MQEHRTKTSCFPALMYINTGSPLVSVTSSCKTGALLTGPSPPLNRRKLHPKHQFTCSRQESGLPSKTNMELELHCTYSGFTSLQYLSRIYFRIEGEGGGWPLINQSLWQNPACPWHTSEGGKALEFHTDIRKPHPATAFSSCREADADSLSLMS